MEHALKPIDPATKAELERVAELSKKVSEVWGEISLKLEKAKFSALSLGLPVLIGVLKIVNIAFTGIGKVISFLNSSLENIGTSLLGVMKMIPGLGPAIALVQQLYKIGGGGKAQGLAKKSSYSDGANDNNPLVQRVSYGGSSGGYGGGGGNAAGRAGIPGGGYGGDNSGPGGGTPGTPSASSAPGDAGRRASGKTAERIAASKAAMEDQLRKEGVPESNIKEAANLMAGQALSESELNPTQSHDQGTGHGIYGARLQRRASMFEWLEKNGYSRNSLEGQSRYMVHEAMTDKEYKQSRDALMNADPAKRAANVNTLIQNFERPSDRGAGQHARRMGRTAEAAGVASGASTNQVLSSGTVGAVTGSSTTAGKNPDGSDLPERVQAVGGGDPAAFITHHTGGRGGVGGVQDTLRQQGLGVQYVMDRNGNIVKTGGPGASHMKTGWGEGAGLSNKNVVGMEIIASDDKDVTPAQAEAYAKFMATRYPNTPIMGHGQVNPGHKEADEGQTARRAALVYREQLNRSALTDSNKVQTDGKLTADVRALLWHQGRG